MSAATASDQPSEDELRKRLALGQKEIQGDSEYGTNSGKIHFCIRNHKARSNKL